MISSSINLINLRKESVSLKTDHYKLPKIKFKKKGKKNPKNPKPRTSKNCGIMSKDITYT